MAKETGFKLALAETPRTGFLATRSKCSRVTSTSCGIGICKFETAMPNGLEVESIFVVCAERWNCSFSFQIIIDTL